MARFQNALREAATGADASAAAIAGSFFKAQTEIVSGFATIGMAALGLADKVAMADQEYRLFALHMYMSKDAARSLKIAMDALGQPLENLTWDKELNRRTRQLIEDQKAMSPGGDFEAQMMKIRDVRFEFTRMEVEMKYLGMHVVQDFMTALGFGPDALLKTLREFNAWVINDMPEISRRLVKDFMPVWKDVKEVVTATGKAIADFGKAFTNIVGVLSGDSTLAHSTGDFEDFSSALVKTADALATIAETLAHVADRLADVIDAAAKASTLDFKGAGQSLTGKKSGLSGAVVGGLILGGGVAIASALLAQPEGEALVPAAAAEGAALGAELTGETAAAAAAAADSASYDLAASQFAPEAETGLAARAWPWVSRWGARSARAVLGWARKHWLMTAGAGMLIGHKIADSDAPNSDGGGGTMTSTPGLTADDWRKASDAVGGSPSPELLSALAAAESGGQGQAARGYDKNGRLAGIGRMQLLASTARSLGVNPYNEQENVLGGSRYMKWLLERYGDEAVAIGAYHDGPGAMDAIRAGKATLSHLGQREVAAVLRSEGRTGDVQVGSVTIHITQRAGENSKELADRTRDALYQGAAVNLRGSTY